MKDNVWLVEHPTYQYVEDVKEVAAKNGLQIVDAKFAESIDKELLTSKRPKLTKKPEYEEKVDAKD